MAPTPGQLVVIQRTITKTAWSFGHRLSPECVEDLVQEVFLRLWKSRAEAKLVCVPFVRRVAANVTIDSLRQRGAKKRRIRRTLSLEAEMARWHSHRTPEEALIEREEAQQLIETDRMFRKRVERAMKQYAKAQAVMAGDTLEMPDLFFTGRSTTHNNERRR